MFSLCEARNTITGLAGSLSEGGQSMERKLISVYTYGLSAHMVMELDGKREEIDVFWKNDGEHYRTTADDNPERRLAIIAAFKELY